MRYISSLVVCKTHTQASAQLQTHKEKHRVEQRDLNIQKLQEVRPFPLLVSSFLKNRQLGVFLSHETLGPSIGFSKAHNHKYVTVGLNIPHDSEPQQLVLPPASDQITGSEGQTVQEHSVKAQAVWKLLALYLNFRSTHTTKMSCSHCQSCPGRLQLS